MENFHIEPAKESDLSDILKIKAQAHEKYVQNRPDLYKNSVVLYTPDFLKPFFENENRYILIAKVDENIAGYIFVEMVSVEKPMMVARKYLYIHDLAVLEDLRRYGIALELLNYVENLANVSGINTIELAVHTFSEHAIKLYEKSGFKQRAIRMEKEVKKIISIDHEKSGINN